MTDGAKDPDCLFCKIVAGDIDADVVHESATTVAFRDLNPQAPTHVLVIPRSHYPNAASARRGRARRRPPTCSTPPAPSPTREGLGEGYRLVFNTGAQAHQTVFHAHMHVLGGRAMTWPPG